MARRFPLDCERGQAAVEFLFAFLFILGLAAGLYQALHFELDVFNKMGQLRYKVFKEARRDQDTTQMRWVEQQIEGKQLSDLTTYDVPFQDFDSTLHYGPKFYSMRAGTKYWFPGGDSAETALDVAIVAGLIADHWEPTSGVFGQVFDALSSALSANPCQCI